MYDKKNFIHLNQHGLASKLIPIWKKKRVCFFEQFVKFGCSNQNIKSVS